MATIVSGLPGAGYYLGQGLGRGLSTGLQELAEQRVQNLRRQQKTNSLVAAGFTPEEAGFIVDNPELANPYLSSLSASGNLSQQQAQPQELEQLLGQPQQQLSPQQKMLQEFQVTNPQQQTTQPVTPRQQLAKPSIRDQLALGQKDENKKYQEVIKRNAPLRKQASKSYSIGEEMLTVINNMENILNQGGVRSGLTGQILGGVLSEPSSTFDAESKKLASLRVQGQGVATNFKLKFAQQQKPSLDQPEGTQRKLLEEARQEAYKMMAPEEAINAILEANGGKEPDDLQSLSFKYLREQYPKDETPKKQATSKGFKSLPSVEEAKKKLKPGTVLLDKKTGVKYTWNGSGYTKKTGEK